MRLLLLCLALCWATGSRAWAQQRLPAAVWLQGPGDGALKTRIEGQTADLDVALLPIARDGRQLASRERLALAGTLLRESGARALVYWEPSPRGGRRLRVLSGDRVFSRELGGEAVTAEEPARSATLESAAVVVRAVLRTLLAGEPAGVSLSEALVEPEGLGEPSAVSPDPAMPRPTPPRRARPELFVSLGWQVVLDGQSPPGQHALSLSLGISISRLVIRLWLHGGLPAELDDGQSQVQLSRQGFALGLSGIAVRTERLRLFGGALLGLCGHYRTTESVRADYQAAPPRYVPALCVTPQVGLRLRPARSVPLELELTAGAEVVAGRPRLGYSDGSAFVPMSEPWPVQPLLGLAVVYLWERPRPAVATVARPADPIGPEPPSMPDRTP